MLKDTPSENQLTSGNLPAGDATLAAVRTLLRAAGYDDQAIDRALAALEDREEQPGSMNELLTAQDVCRWLGISLSTLWRWNVPHLKLCGLRRFYRSDVEKFLNARYTRKPPPAGGRSVAVNRTSGAPV